VSSVTDMSWSRYADFLAFAVVLVLVPGPDFAVTTKNTLAGGARRGRWTALGVTTANLLQGTAAAFGLGALIVAVQPLFQAVRWAGVAYLTWLGAQAIRSAIRGQYPPLHPADSPTTPQNAPQNPSRNVPQNVAGWRQGFVSNITNPKVLVFDLAILPQFLTRGAGVGWLLLVACTIAALGLVYLLILIAGLHHARRLLARRPIRRALDATTGTILLAFSARLAASRL
jgi:threonine/homoserine/homoserine lactone efflux protein